jgi:hypothetical protein
MLFIRVKISEYRHRKNRFQVDRCQLHLNRSQLDIRQHHNVGSIGQPHQLLRQPPEFGVN